MTLAEKQAQMAARHAPEPRAPKERTGHNRRSATERLLRDVMRDPAASPEARMKAALAVERMRNRRLAAKKAEAAANPPEAEPPVHEPTLAEQEQLVAELRRRGLLDPPTPPPKPVFRRVLDLQDGRGPVTYQGDSWDALVESIRNGQLRADELRGRRAAPAPRFVVELNEPPAKPIS